MARLGEGNRRRRLLLVLLLVTSLVVVTVDFRSHGKGPLSRLGRSVSSVLGPLQDGFEKVLHPIGNFFAGFTQVGSLRSRIRQLEQENGLLKQQEGQVVDITRENERLRELLGMRDRLGLKVVTAEVVGVAPSNFEHSVVIDRGSADGVVKNMAVIGPSGLVGHVVEASGHSARVLLISDPSSSVASRVAVSGEAGLVDGTGESELRFELYDSKGTVSAGDDVVTSGYQQSIYPPGIPIGSVVRVEPQGGNLLRVAFVRPAADFTSLDYVLVVTEGGGQ